jgi:hypothetical protein
VVDLAQALEQENQLETTRKLLHMKANENSYN